MYNFLGCTNPGIYIIIATYIRVCIPDTTTSPCTLDLWRAVEVKNPFRIVCNTIYRIGTGRRKHVTSAVLFMGGITPLISV